MYVYVLYMYIYVYIYMYIYMYMYKVFSTSLYMKPAHSHCITPWDSHGSIASKRSVLIGEAKRAIKCSTDSASQKKSLDVIVELFVNNGYPRKFVKAVIRYTLQNINTPRKDDTEQNQNFVYLKLPFINEDFKRRACSVIRRSGIDQIKVHFMTGRPSSQVFAPTRERLNCPDNCETCKSATRPNQCFLKNVVYQITCSICGTVYIGETSRTIGTRIKEHLTMKKQTVFKHLNSHQISADKDMPNFSWKILLMNIKNHGDRKCIEALEIKRYSDNVMNDCIGKTICI